MFVCCQCGKPAALVLNVCAECNPALHRAWNAAVDSAADYDTVTPEMEKAYVLMRQFASQVGDVLAPLTHAIEALDAVIQFEDRTHVLRVQG